MKIITRAQAKKDGKKHYFTGKPCIRGHIDLRNTGNGKCAECNRENVAAWRAANPELEKEVQRRSWENNGPKFNKQRRARRAQTPEEVREVERLYRKNNPEKVLAKKQKERAGNREYYRQKTREWGIKNPEKRSAQGALRRAIELERSIRLSGDLKELNDFCFSEIYSLKQARELATGIEWNVDHQVPLRHPKACGLHLFTNIELVPAGFNRKKSNRLITETLDWAKREEE